MEATRKRQIRSGSQYDHLFPRATLQDITVKKGANVYDTVKFIPKVVKAKSWQTSAFVKQELKGLNTYDACKKLWHFIYQHIAYRKDEQGLEQIRSPARAWRDRFRGVDCDCYSTFISCVLTQLGINHTLRIAKYGKDYFQHIYPVVPISDGSYITIDCVVNEFNYEEPYTEIKDTKMDLQLLDGIDNEEVSGTEEEVYGIEEDQFGQLGWSLKKAVKKVTGTVKKAASKVGNTVAKGATFVGKKVIAKGATAVAKAAVKAGKFTAEKVGQGIHLLNKINPATLLLRNGFYAAMKMNTFNVAHNLRLAYLSKEEAQKRNINLGKHASLNNIRKKLQSIVYAAGGTDKDLKNAILKGKGNQGKDKVLAGLDGIEDVDFGALNGMDENTSLYQVLGPELFNSSNVISEQDLQGLISLQEGQVEGLEGLDLSGVAEGYYVGQELTGLGEPVTLSIGAASGALATIAGLISKLGNLYDKGKAVMDKVKPITNVAKAILPKNSGSAAPQAMQEAVMPPTANTAEAPEPDPGSAERSSSPPPSSDEAEDGNSDADEDQTNTSTTKAISPTVAPVVVSSGNLPVKMQSQAVQAAAPAAQASFWEKHKKWLKPTLIGAGGLGIVYLGYKMLYGKKTKSSSPEPVQGLTGLNAKKKPKRKKKQAAQGKHKPIELM